MSTRAERKARVGRCQGCGERNARHFVPPSFGDEGFYMCPQHLVNGKVVDGPAPHPWRFP